MNVYLLYGIDIKADEDSVIGVFSTREGAEKYRDCLILDGEWDYYFISQRPVMDIKVEVRED